MTARVPAATLVAMVVTLTACRDANSRAPAPAPAPPSVETPRPTPTASAPTAAPLRPTLPEPAAGGDAGVQSPAEAFAAEPIDRTWNTVAEQRVRAKLPGAKVACHQTLCEVTLAGDDAALARDLDRMNELRELAQSVVLTAPVEQDGRHVLRGYVRFDRPVEDD